MLTVLTPRLLQGCSISAYHYNLVANMMLMTCATHLVCVTTARHYWEYPYLASLRVLVTTGVYLVTGLLLSNQNVDPSWGFPTEVPETIPSVITDNTTASALTMFLPAACFQADSSHLADTLSTSFSTPSAAEQAFLFSTVRDKIHGWNMYLVMLLFYTLSLLFAIGRLIQSWGRHRQYGGWRAAAYHVFHRLVSPLLRLRWFLHLFFAVYQAGGIGVASWTIVETTEYMFQLRSWADHSGWLQTSGGVNPENDPTSFGQLVPMCLVCLTLFTFLATFSGKSRRLARLSRPLPFSRSSTKGFCLQLRPDEEEQVPQARQTRTRV